MLQKKGSFVTKGMFQSSHLVMILAGMSLMINGSIYVNAGNCGVGNKSWDTSYSSKRPLSLQQDLSILVLT